MSDHPSLPLPSWFQIPTLGNLPSERSGHCTFIYHRSLYLYGGFHNDIVLSGLYKLDLDTLVWTYIKCKGIIPDSRTSHSMVIDSISGLVYLCCGSGPQFGHSNMNDIYELNIHTHCWRKLIFNKIIDSRYGQSVIYYKRKLVLFGGTFGHTFSNELIIFDLQTMNVDILNNSNNAPSGRYKHSVSVIDNKMYLFGGSTANSSKLKDFYVLDLDYFVWDRLPDIPVEGRFAHTMQVVGKKIYVYGGTNKVKVYGDVFCINLEDDDFEVKPVNCASFPAPRYFHSCEYDSVNELMFIIGGKVSNTSQVRLNDIHVLSLKSTHTKYCTLSSDLIKLFKSQKLCDLTICSTYNLTPINNKSSVSISDSMKIHVHAAVIFSRCPSLIKELHVEKCDNSSLIPKFEIFLFLPYNMELLNTFVKFLYTDSLRLVYESDLELDGLFNPSRNICTQIDQFDLSSYFDSKSIPLTLPEYEVLPIEHFFQVLLFANKYKLNRLSWLAECRLRNNMTESLYPHFNYPPDSIGSFASFLNNYDTEIKDSLMINAQMDSITYRRMLIIHRSFPHEHLPPLQSLNSIQLNNIFNIHQLLLQHQMIRTRIQQENTEEMERFQSSFTNPNHIAQFQAVLDERTEELDRLQQLQLSELRRANREQEVLFADLPLIDFDISSVNDTDVIIEEDLNRMVLFHNYRANELYSMRVDSSNYNLLGVLQTLAIDLLLLRKTQSIPNQLIAPFDCQFNFIELTESGPLVKATYFAHKALLAARSNYFATNSFLKEVDLNYGIYEIPVMFNQISIKAFDVFLDYIYGDLTSLKLNSCAVSRLLSPLNIRKSFTTNRNSMEIVDVEDDVENIKPRFNLNIADEFVTFDIVNYFGLSSMELVEFCLAFLESEKHFSKRKSVMEQISAILPKLFLTQATISSTLTKSLEMLKINPSYYDVYQFRILVESIYKK